MYNKNRGHTKVKNVIKVNMYDFVKPQKFDRGCAEVVEKAKLYLYKKFLLNYKIS